jgi:hydroxysqualene synthase
MVGLQQAYASCEQDARAHYENFPVASILVPASMRRHIAAVYAFARAADDFADEGTRLPEERLALLDGWCARLHASVSGGEGAPPAPGEPANTEEIFRALGATIHDRHLPIELFDDLLSAFRQDVTVRQYATWAHLLDYCRRSANPVGRLVLRIAGYRDDRLDRWSDDICTALQLTNFWQDLRIDLERGREYIPQDVLRVYASSRPAPSGPGKRFAPAVEDVVVRTRALFDSGRPLCDAVHGRLRYELRATWLGGVRILDRLRASGYDPVSDRPSLGAGDAPWLAWRLCTWAALR